MRSRLFLLLSFCFTSCLLANASAPQGSPDPLHLWRRQTQEDLRAANRVLKWQYIYSVYPEPGWNQLYERAVQEAQAQAKEVHNFADYSYVLRHFFAAFKDPHLFLRDELQPVRVQWPGFSLLYQGGQYLVAASEAASVQPGEIVTSCDGKSMEVLNARASRAAFGWAGSQAVKADLAGRLLIDSGNRFEPRVHTCIVGSRSVTLEWRSIRQADLRNISAPFSGVHDHLIEAEPFATNGEWVRLATFQPDNVAEATAFHKVISQAAELRDKNVIVIDLRGNGGGSYQWFMAFLRELYGPQMTDFYARERLKIQAYFVPSAVTPDDNKPPAQDPLNTPHDPLIEQSEADPVRVLLPNGQQAYRQQRIPEAASGTPAGPPPENPVKAKVFVLTDNNSASAVNSFLDEVLHFPGVVQIGTAPLSDRRSGSPAPYNLPSGNATLYVPAMVRIGRSRGEMEEYEPKVRFDGNITDTNAVKLWVLTTVQKAAQ